MVHVRRDTAVARFICRPPGVVARQADRARDSDTQNRNACAGFLAAVLKAHAQYTGILTIKRGGQLLCD
jgi:hypothetical protein